MKVKAEYVIFAVFSVILLIGCYNVYFVDHGDYSYDCTVDASGISLSVEGAPSDYRYSIYSNTDVPTKMYLYLDEGYQSQLNTYYHQSEFLGVLKDMLSRRGLEDIQYVDSEGLKTIMTSKCSIFFVSGARPDTVYDGSGSDIFTDWLDLGGSVYWAGPEIGRYISTPDGVTDLDIGFFGGKVSDKEKNYGYNHSEMYEYTCVRYDDCTYGLDVTIPDSLPLGYISDDGYSAITVAKLGNGSVTVFGGQLTVTENISQVLTDRTFSAEIVMSGLTYQSEGLAHGTGVSSQGTEHIDIDISSYGDVALVISVGEPASKWGRTHLF